MSETPKRGVRPATCVLLMVCCAFVAALAVEQFRASPARAERDELQKRSDAAVHVLAIATEEADELKKVVPKNDLIGRDPSGWIWKASNVLRGSESADLVLAAKRLSEQRGR